MIYTITITAFAILSQASLANFLGAVNATRFLEAALRRQLNTSEIPS